MGHDTLKCNYVEFSNACYVKGFKYNLIVIIKLCDANCDAHFNKKEGVVSQLAN